MIPGIGLDEILTRKSGLVGKCDIRAELFMKVLKIRIRTFLLRDLEGSI
jgi:hypothetical protein